MADLWAPPDIHALPSPEELQQAKNAIKYMKKLLSDVVALPDSRFQIKKKIFGYKAWIAPIRKVYQDALSLIFVECSRHNWKAPMTIERVCRYWKQAVRNTPHVWSFISFDEYMSPAIYAKYMEYGGKTQLHVAYVGRHIPNTVINDLSDRIHCLRTNNEAALIGPSYPLVHRLIIDERAGEDRWKPLLLTISFLKVSRFPNLRYLSMSCNFISAIPTIESEQELPPIQYLQLTIGIYSKWSLIVRKLSKSLVALGVKIYDYRGNYSITAQLTLPRLRSLEVDDYRIRTSLFELNFDAPLLRQYEHHASVQDQHHPLSNTLTIETLHISTTIQIRSFPQLRRILFLGPFGPVESAVTAFVEDPDLCPGLEEVGYICPPSNRHKLRIPLNQLRKHKKKTKKAVTFSQYTTRVSFCEFVKSDCPDGFVCRDWGRLHS